MSVHTTEGTKLDGWLKIGKWVSFDEISNGHCIYWPNKCSVTIEHSVKCSNGDMLIPPNPVVQPIQGEREQRNLKNDSEIKIGALNLENESQEHTKNHQQHSEIQKCTTSNPRSMEMYSLQSNDR